MRSVWCVLIVSCIGFASCQRATKESQVMALLHKIDRVCAENPDDLNLRLLFSELDAQAAREEAQQTSDPVYLSYFANTVFDIDMDQARREALLDITTRWKQADPGNGAPLLMEAWARLLERDLPGFLDGFRKASECECIDNRELQIQSALYEAVKQHNLDHVLCRRLVFARHPRVETMYRGIFNVHHDYAEAWIARCDWGRARQLYEVEAEVGLKLSGSSVSSLSGFLVTVTHYMALRDLAAFALVENDRELFDSHVKEIMRRIGDFAVLREAWKNSPVLEDESDFLSLLGRLVKARNHAGGGGALGDYLGAANSPDMQQFEEWLDKRADVFDKLDKELITKGENTVVMSFVSEKTIRDIREFCSQAEVFEQWLPVIQTERLERRQIDALFQFCIDARDIEGDNPAGDIIRRALLLRLLREKPEAAVAAMNNITEENRFWGRYRSAVILYVITQDKGVIDNILADDPGYVDFDEAWYHRVVGLSDQRERVGPLLAEMKECLDICDNIEMAINISFALHDLTGFDGGIDVQKWETWLAQQPK